MSELTSSHPRGSTNATQEPAASAASSSTYASTVASTAASDASELPSTRPSHAKLASDEEADVGQSNARRVFHAFDPYRQVMGPLLRFPLQQKETSDGNFQFVFKKGSYAAIGFVVVSVFIAVITFLILINTIGTILDFPAIQKDVSFKDNKWAKNNTRFDEMFIMRRNIVPIIVIITSLFHATVGSWQIFRQRNFIASYLTFWTEAVKSSKIDAAYGMKRYMQIVLGSYVLFLVIFTILNIMRFAPVSAGAPAVLTILTFRCFYPPIHNHGGFWVLRGFSGLLFIYIMICSKAFMFLFLLVSRMLKNSFLIWNHRLDRALHRGEDAKKREEKLAQRTSFDCLFQDHVCLLDLLEGTDTMFSNIIETFYASQTISIVFEIYYFYKSQTALEEFKGARRLDGIIVFLYLMQSFIILYIVSIAGSEVGDEAIDGLEILRRKGIMGKKSDDELYFMISMHTSYTGHFETAITGGGFFTLDKGFLIGVVGTVLSYFIILIQFSPRLTIDTEGRKEQSDLEEILTKSEGTYGYFGLATGYLTLKNFTFNATSLSTPGPYYIVYPS